MLREEKNESIYFRNIPPVIRASGKIIRDLAIEFKEHNHKSVLTLVEEENRKNAQVEIYDEDGIKIIKC